MASINILEYIPIYLLIELSIYSSKHIISRTILFYFILFWVSLHGSLQLESIWPLGNVAALTSESLWIKWCFSNMPIMTPQLIHRVLKQSIWFKFVSYNPLVSCDYCLWREKNSSYKIVYILYMINYNFLTQTISWFWITSNRLLNISNFNSLQLTHTNYTSHCDFISQLAGIVISNIFYFKWTTRDLFFIWKKKKKLTSSILST